MRKFAGVALAAAMLVPVGLVASPAGAATGSQCTKSVGVTNLKTGIATDTLSGCTPVSATGGSGKVVVKITAKTTTVVWAAGKGTTVVKQTTKAGPKVNKCPKGTTLLILSGSVVGGSGAALKAMPKGQAVSDSLCLNTKTDDTTLEPGTVSKY
jgi:hypothetical protein